MTGGPGNRVEVRPEELRAGAHALRGDAGALGAAGSRGSAAASSLAQAAGAEPLATAAADFGRRLDTALRAVQDGLLRHATALDTSAAAFLVRDAEAARALEGLRLPDLGGPGGR